MDGLETTRVFRIIECISMCGHTGQHRLPCELCEAYCYGVAMLVSSGDLHPNLEAIYNFNVPSLYQPLPNLSVTESLWGEHAEGNDIPDVVYPATIKTGMGRVKR